MPISRLIAILIPLVLLTIGCQEAPLRVGVKPFTEQMILGEVVEAVLEHHDIPTGRRYRCRDTFDCEQAMREGRIDIRIEYLGTAAGALAIAESTGADGQAPDAMSKAMEIAYAERGMRWGPPLGFENGYVWLAPSSLVQGAGTTPQVPVTTISELATLGRPLRVASPPEYLRRAGDGLDATATRYGLTIADDPLVSLDPTPRYEAARRAEVDVVIGYETDPETASSELVMLEDDLEHFPSYAANIVVREDALTRFPALDDALGSLSKEFDNDTMRVLNREVETVGHSAATAARRHLARSELIEAGEDVPGPRWVMGVDADLVELARAEEARRAVRDAFPKRAVELRVMPEPAGALAEGSVRVALVGSEAFFGRRGRPQNQLEALIALQPDLLHQLQNQTEAESAGLVAGYGAVAARRVALEMDLKPTTFDDLQAATSALESGTVGRLLLFAPAGHDALQPLLSQTGIRRVPVPSGDLRIPGLRPARFADGLESLERQIVLAGPSATRAGTASPAGGAPTAVAFDYEEVVRMAEASDNHQLPASSLPSVWTQSRSLDRAEPTIAWKVAEVSMNLVAFAFVGWLVFLLVFATTRED